MTITIIVKNENPPEHPVKAIVETVDYGPDGEAIGTQSVAQLGGGEQVTTYVTDTRDVIVREE